MGNLYEISDYEAEKILRGVAKEYHGGEGSRFLDENNETITIDDKLSPKEKLAEAERLILEADRNAGVREVVDNLRDDVEHSKKQYEKGAQDTITSLRDELGINKTPPGERLRKLTEENHSG